MVMELKILQSNRSNPFKVLIGQEKKNKLPPKLIVYNQGVVVGARAFTGFLVLPLSMVPTPPDLLSFPVLHSPML
jgi:hypothetical protein